MKWNERKTHRPPEEPILIFCGECKQAHIVIYELESYRIPEFHLPPHGLTHAGVECECFEWWMPLPGPP